MPDQPTYSSVDELVRWLREYALSGDEPRPLAVWAADELEALQRKYELAAAEAAHLLAEVQRITPTLNPLPDGN